MYTGFSAAERQPLRTFIKKDPSMYCPAETEIAVPVFSGLICRRGQGMISAMTIDPVLENPAELFLAALRNQAGGEGL
jgi:hypothetical protein